MALVRARLLSNLSPHGKANLINSIYDMQEELARRGVQSIFEGIDV